MCDAKQEATTNEIANRIKVLMNELNISKDNRPVIQKALDKASLEGRNVIALQLPNSKIITGKQTELLSPVSALIINAIKELTNIPDDVYLLSPSILKPILKLKHKSLYSTSKSLNLQEVLIALSICSATNPIIENAINNMDNLKGCEAHASYIVTDGELNILKNLKINLTCEPVFKSNIT